MLRMVLGSWYVNCTRIGVTTLGRISLRTIRHGEAPETLAASTNSRSRRDSTVDRTSRAMPIQPSSHSTMSMARARKYVGVSSRGSTKNDVTTGMKAMKNSCCGKERKKSVPRPIQ